MQSWTWRQVWQRRLEQHCLIRPVSHDQMLQVVGKVCGIHAQIGSSAEFSLGLRVVGITRGDVRRALWEERTLVKTYGLRGTLHIFPASELGLWLAALRAKPRPRDLNQYELDALPPARRDELLNTVRSALDGRVLARDELESEIHARLGPWATEPVFPAFGGRWPRWQLWLSPAALDGIMVFGPNRGSRVTYARADQWLGPLPDVSGDDALREICRRFLAAYGPATHEEFARWFLTKPASALDIMHGLDLEEVDVEGWRACVLSDCGDPPSVKDTVHLLPQYDCYIVGAHPRQQFIPDMAQSARKLGTAAPFNVVLLNGVVGGFWERKQRGRSLEVRVDTFTPLSKAQKELAEQQAARIGEILQTTASVSFGAVNARAHL